MLPNWIDFPVIAINQKAGADFVITFHKLKPHASPITDQSFDLCVIIEIHLS